MTTDLIVPTIDGREDSLKRCVDSFEENTPKKAKLNVIVVPESRTCGWGWMQGLAASTADYVALVADDIECISETWWEVCVECADLDMLACPRVYKPDGSVESQGGDMNALGHIISRHRADYSLCDFTTVPFMSKEQAEAIGMIDTQYACDLWVSYRGRDLGYDTTLVHGYDLVHHMEAVGRGAGMSQNDRDAMDCATAFKELEKRREQDVRTAATP